MLFEQIERNERISLAIISLHILLFVAVGAAFGYVRFQNMWLGMIIFGVLGWCYTNKLLNGAAESVLWASRAREITEKEQAPRLWNVVEEMSIVARVPMPRIFVIEDDSPNSFVVGMDPDNACLAVTSGLMVVLNRSELEGVLAHEFAHIRNYDVRLQTIVAAFGSALSFIFSSGTYPVRRGRSSYHYRSSGGAGSRSGGNIVLYFSAIIVLLIAPFVSYILKLALSRNREYLADAMAIHFTRNPEALISALEKMTKEPPMIKADIRIVTLYFINPYTDRHATEDSLFGTHPATCNRILRLQEM